MSFQGVFAYPFARQRMNALLTNRLHHVSDQTPKLSAKINELMEKGLTQKKLKYRSTGEIEVCVPIWLDWEMCRFKCCCCFCRSRNKSMKVYEDIIKLGHLNFFKNLDIVSVIRRSRLHAIGLHFLLNKIDRNLSARLAFSTPLRTEYDLMRGKLADPSDAN